MSRAELADTAVDDDHGEPGVASRPMDLPFEVHHAREEDDEEALGQDEIRSLAEFDELDDDDDDPRRT
jgi:hypothetical protein